MIQNHQLRVDVTTKGQHAATTKAPPPSANKSIISAASRVSPVKQSAPNPLKVYILVYVCSYTDDMTMVW